MRRRSKIDRKILDGFLTKETSFLMTAEVKALVGTMRISVEQLIEQLLPWAAEKAIVPVSRFKVGGVCRGNSGNLYLGANIEFKGMPVYTTIHAEQASIANAMSHGETGIKSLSVTAPPCGMCRQFLNELNTSAELKIQIGNDEPVLLPQILPQGFGPDDLDVRFKLMDDVTKGFNLENPTDDELANKALEAANKSHSPYTSSHAGVAIKTRNGQIFIGHYLENAAYNPSMLPLQAGLSNLVMAGRNFAEISDVVLVQCEDAAVNHIEAAQKLLNSISSVPLRVYKAV